MRKTTGMNFSCNLREARCLDGDVHSHYHTRESRRRPPQNHVKQPNSEERGKPDEENIRLTRAGMDRLEKDDNQLALSAVVSVPHCQHDVNWLSRVS